MFAPGEDKVAKSRRAIRWFSAQGDFSSPTGDMLAISGDVVDCLQGPPGFYWVEARDAVQHPTRPRTVTHHEE